MKTFITENFLLHNKYAVKLYHLHAKELPIIDYHNHLPPKAIAENMKYDNLTQVWLDGDHYKWRAMRALGVDEKFITGNASDKEKFHKWAEILPKTVRNPLYHWSHLEMMRYFDVDTLLNQYNADEIYHKTANQLSNNNHATVGLLKQQNVEMVCTTDDPCDDLKYHKNIGENAIGIKVLPGFRPDNALKVEDIEVYLEYLEKLGEASGVTIASFEHLKTALANRISFFHENGCRISDHGLKQLYVIDENDFDIDAIFKKVLQKKTLGQQEIKYFKMKLLLFLCKSYYKKGWVQQFHLGPIRNNNTRLLKKLGPDTGFDSIGDYPQAEGLAFLLNTLDSTEQLSKTIIYNLNPAYNEIFATMAGNFNDGSVKGKIQYGAAWWFLDQKDGIEKHLNTMSNLGILSTFIGMLTDSRSFLSFPRHEYFRRILCNLIGRDIQNGELPNDIDLLGGIVQDVCYYNAKRYFEF